MPIIGLNKSVTIFRSWPDFKKLIDGTEKSLRPQLEETDKMYDIFCADESVVYRTEIFKSNFIPVGWNQQKIDDNASYRNDFQTNWMSEVNQPQRIASVADHYNGNATSSANQVTFAQKTRSIIIENLGRKELLVSLDGGVNYKTLADGDRLTAKLELNSVYLKSGDGPGAPFSGADYEIVVLY